MVVNFTRFLSKLILPFLLTTIFQSEIQSQSTGYGTFTCKTYGRYPDPNDCMSYYECFPTFTSARLTVQKQRCPAGKGFHDKLKKCVSLKKLKDCNSRQSRFERVNVELNPLCATPDVNFVCADCQTLIHCIKGVAYVTQCDAAESCSVFDSFDSGVCAPNIGEGKCSCSSISNNTYLPDPFDNTKFFTCESQESLPEIFECPVNRVFNDSLQKCTDGEGLPSCSAEGTFSVPENCTKYYSCIQTKYSWLQKSYECEAKQMFSESSGMCQDPCHWQSGDFTCKEEGRFRNPSDCKTFFVCILNGTENFILKKRSCPNSYNWLSNEDNVSGKCSDDLSLCKPIITQHQCNIPADLCPASVSSGAPDTPESVTSSGSSPNEEPTTTPKATPDETEVEGSGADGSSSVDNSEPTTAEPVDNSENEAPGVPDVDSTSTEEDVTTVAGTEPTEPTEPTPGLRTASEELKKEDPIAFIRNLLNRQ